VQGAARWGGVIRKPRKGKTWVRAQTRLTAMDFERYMELENARPRSTLVNTVLNEGRETARKFQRSEPLLKAETRGETSVRKSRGLKKRMSFLLWGFEWWGGRLKLKSMGVGRWHEQANEWIGGAWIDRKGTTQAMSSDRA